MTQAHQNMHRGTNPLDDGIDRYFGIRVSNGGNKLRLSGLQTNTKVLWTPVCRIEHPRLMERGPEISGVQNDLRRVVDALPGLIWTAQPDGQIDFVNQRWCEYTGLSANEAHG